MSVSSNTTLIKLGIFKNSSCEITNVLLEGTITITSSNAVEFGGLVHTLTESLSYVTSTLRMTKNVGTIRRSGGIAAIINAAVIFDIHHIILSGYLYSKSSTGFMEHH